MKNGLGTAIAQVLALQEKLILEKEELLAELTYYNNPYACSYLSYEDVYKMRMRRLRIKLLDKIICGFDFSAEEKEMIEYSMAYQNACDNRALACAACKMIEWLFDKRNFRDVSQIKKKPAR